MGICGGFSCLPARSRGSVSAEAGRALACAMEDVVDFQPGVKGAITYGAIAVVGDGDGRQRGNGGGRKRLVDVGAVLPVIGASVGDLAEDGLPEPVVGPPTTYAPRGGER